jgi:nitroreductase
MDQGSASLEEQRAEARRVLTTYLVDGAITSRRSVRAFLPKKVPRELVEGILSVASRAPSGANTQPWRVHVVAGQARTRLVTAVQRAFDDKAVAQVHTEEYPYYPRQWTSPYLERRRKVGFDLYGLVGIPRGDKPRMQAQERRNFQFFDAPVGLLFTMDRVMEQGSFLDYGMFLQSLMVAARARGLDTCPQASFNKFHRVVEHELGLPASERLVCAMSLGYADPSKVENSLRTEREPVGSFAVFHE